MMWKFKNETEFEEKARVKLPQDLKSFDCHLPNAEIVKQMTSSEHFLSGTVKTTKTQSESSIANT